MAFPLSNHGVLGMNARNLLYIKPFNPRKAVAFADDKMKTKAYLSARGIPTAKLFARIETRRQLKNFDFSSLPDACVLKPNNGFGGEGILILEGRRGEQFLEQGKRVITRRELTEHIEDILDGKFSVSGHPDTAFFEQILEADECFTPFRPAGLPDIRIIVFNLVPVMAMLRIPTPESHGKANVHLGGIGIGIDIVKGVTTHAAQFHSMLRQLPHGLPVAGVTIPRWEELLLIASKIQYITNIGYAAVDLTIDRNLGPVLLEVNARAGLMVQVANLAPLRSRLERVEGLQVGSPEKGVRLTQELFGEKHGRGDRPEGGKRVLAIRESIEIAGEGVRIEELCALDPERPQTVFTCDFIAELLKLGAIEAVEGSNGSYRLKFTLGGRKIQTIVTEGAIQAKDVRASIGSRDLSGFLIDPAIRPVKPVVPGGVRRDLRAIDRILATIDRELSVLKFLRPVNVSEERERLLDDREYNPVFLLRECTVDLGDAERTLKRIETDDSPLGILLRKKRRELLLKIELLRARGDSERFTAASLALYGAPSPALIGFAREHLASRLACDLPPKIAELFSAEAAKPAFEKFLLSYGLHDWVVEVKRGIIADCAVGERRIYLRSGADFSQPHLQALFAHEIETHALTAENGRIQPYEIFRRGFANYLDTQEGLAIFNQNRVLPPHHEKRYLHAKNVLAVAFAAEHSFAEVRRYLITELGFDEAKAVTKSIEVKRGLSRTADTGAFTRSLVYFRGLRAVDQFVRQGGNLGKLYVGKIAIEDLTLIDQMEGVRRPLILPMFLRETGTEPVKKTRGSGRRKKL